MCCPEEEEGVWLGARRGHSRAGRGPGDADKMVVPVTVTALSTRKFFPQNLVARTEVNFFLNSNGFFSMLLAIEIFYVKCYM